MGRSADAWAEEQEQGERDAADAAWAREQELFERRRREDAAIARMRELSIELVAILTQLKLNRTHT